MKKITHEMLERQIHNPYLQWWAAGMPTYSAPGAQPVKQIIVKFETREDKEEFLKLCNFENITDKTKITKYPQEKSNVNRMNRYIDESEL